MKTDIFGKLDQAAAKALRRQDQIFGFQSDPALRQYERLTPTDFLTIGQTYGPDQLIHYVRTMESRRMRGRNGQ